MSDHATVARQLSEALALRLPPIAVALTDTIPPGVASFDGRVPAGCQFWERAATGAFATTTRDHELCSIGVHTHNLADPSPAQATELEKTLSVMADLDYVRADEVAAIPVVERSVKHVIYAPLADAPVAPDVVLVFADARQGLVITEAVQQVDAGVPPALGRPACAIVPQAMNSGHAALSLGCCGARAYVDAMSDGVALWAFPGARIAEYADRIKALGHANDVLGQFHERRRRDVANGDSPTVAESLARLSASG